MTYFPRPQLAASLADNLQGKTLFEETVSGLFLAAPRRTGKSTFLQNDLRPELERRDIVVVYVDLWSDLKRDPGKLISEKIAEAIRSHLGVVARASRSAGLESVTIAGALKIDTSKIGSIDGITLSDAIRVLAGTAKKPVALIIDEAQHALTSADGETAMVALKSARDQLNGPDAVQLMLIMSGSDRDKLLRLVNTNRAPFFGSSIQRMPLLGIDYIDYVSALIERRRPDLAPVDQRAMMNAFTQFQHRPELFSAALGELLNPLSDEHGRFEFALRELAEAKEREAEGRMASQFLALKPVERAVLWRLMEEGERFRPYDAAALQFYAEKAAMRVTAIQAQNALEALRNQVPPMLWKSARGEYAVDDTAMQVWFEKEKLRGDWPPQDTGRLAESPELPSKERSAPQSQKPRAR